MEMKKKIVIAFIASILEIVSCFVMTALIGGGINLCFHIETLDAKLTVYYLVGLFYSIAMVTVLNNMEQKAIEKARREA